MRYINVVFENDEFEKLLEKKGSFSWHDFILKLLNEDNKNDE